MRENVDAWHARAEGAGPTVVDTDGDKVPDALEDLDGDGNLDDDETNHNALGLVGFPSLYSMWSGILPENGHFFYHAALPCSGFCPYPDGFSSC